MDRMYILFPRFSPLINFSGDWKCHWSCRIDWSWCRRQSSPSSRHFEESSCFDVLFLSSELVSPGTIITTQEALLLPVQILVIHLKAAWNKRTPMILVPLSTMKDFTNHSMGWHIHQKALSFQIAAIRLKMSSKTSRYVLRSILLTR